MTHLRVELPDEVAAELTRLAEERGTTPETLLAELAAEKLADHRAELERLIAEGEADVAAGRVIEHGEAMLEMRAWAARIRAKADARR
jgi:predicted transcriptional regulator